MTDLALSSAVSSLLLLQKQMSVTSSNISNANTAGYTAESEQVSALVVGGVGGGVQDLGTISNVDKYLQAQVVKANSASTQADTFNSYYQNLQQLMGQIGQNDTGGNDISSQLATLQTNFSQLAATPQNSSLGNAAIASLDDLTSNLRSTSQQVQALRTQADQQVSDTVTDVNTQLDSIASLNTLIASTKARGGSTAGLEDQRAVALQNLSADIGISYYTNDQGAVQVTTTSGQALIDGSFVNHLSHSPVTASGSVSYPGGGIGGIMVQGKDLTTNINSGKLASLIQQRDQELPAAQNSLDYLAQQVSAGLNAVSNLGSANPPPATLSSADPANFSDSSQSDGSLAVTTTSAANLGQNDLVVRVGLVDSAGQVQAYQDVDLATATSAQAMCDTINAQFNNPTAAVDANGNAVQMASIVNGKMVLGLSLADPTVTGGIKYPVTLSSGTQTAQIAGPIGIAVSTLSGGMAIPPDPTDPSVLPSSYTDFSSFFHLNDIVANGSSAASIAVNPAMLKNSNLMPVGQLNNTVPAPTSVPFAGVGAGDGSIAQALSAAMLQNQTFTAGTATGTKTFAAPNQVIANTGSFIINGGSGPVAVSIPTQADALLSPPPTITLQYVMQAINDAASAAGVTGVSAQIVGNGTSQLQITSGGGTLSFSNVTGTVLSALGISSASPTGNLGAATTTFGGFASNLISDIAGRAATAKSVSTEKSTTLSALQTTFSNQSGVNVDQQTAQLTQLQNLYAASARVITTVNQMFSALLTAVQA